MFGAIAGLAARIGGSAAAKGAAKAAAPALGRQAAFQMGHSAGRMDQTSASQGRAQEAEWGGHKADQGGSSIW